MFNRTKATFRVLADAVRFGTDQPFYQPIGGHYPR